MVELKKDDKVQRFMESGVVVGNFEVSEVKVDGNMIEKVRVPVVRIQWEGRENHHTDHKLDADLEEHLAQLKIVKVG